MLLERSLLHFLALFQVTHFTPSLLGLSLFFLLPSVVHLTLLASVLTCTLLWQEELEHLNQASEEINQVELQLDVSASFLTPLGRCLERSLSVSLDRDSGRGAGVSEK